MTYIPPTSGASLPTLVTSLILATALVGSGCNGNNEPAVSDTGLTDMDTGDADIIDDGTIATGCSAEPSVRETNTGVEFVRTPDECFENLPGWPYELLYLEIDGLRQAYVDEGPEDGPVVLLLHGQPAWSYLYRKLRLQPGGQLFALRGLGLHPVDSDELIDFSGQLYL